MAEINSKFNEPGSSRAAIVWSQKVLQLIPSGGKRLLEEESHLVKASAFTTTDTTLDAMSFVSRVMASSVMARRGLWLWVWQAWQADVQSELIVASCIAAIEEAPIEDKGSSVYSIFFTVPKRNGDWRSILDLKVPDQVHPSLPFPDGNPQDNYRAHQPGEFMMSLDMMSLLEAYLHVFTCTHPCQPQ